jgi:hypothetical protein
MRGEVPRQLSNREQHRCGTLQGQDADTGIKDLTRPLPAGRPAKAFKASRAEAFFQARPRRCDAQDRRPQTHRRQPRQCSASDCRAAAEYSRATTPGSREVHGECR